MTDPAATEAMNAVAAATKGAASGVSRPAPVLLG